MNLTGKRRVCGAPSSWPSASNRRGWPCSSRKAKALMIRSSVSILRRLDAGHQVIAAVASYFLLIDELHDRTRRQFIERMMVAEGVLQGIDDTRSDSGLIASRAVFGRAVCPIYRRIAPMLSSLWTRICFRAVAEAACGMRDFMEHRRGPLVEFRSDDQSAIHRGMHADDNRRSGGPSIAAFRSRSQSFARELAAELGVSVDRAGADEFRRFLAAVARDLSGHRGSCLIVPGEYQPPEVHALAMAMNDVVRQCGAHRGIYRRD